ncbi:kinase-like protein [Aspergillus eucalypticola CBS 122712]|uniref:Kinase-like protein n=1 Tax=Aspergillus eucalypticola (strain CBS 122712 / IBT 29274) TaxID=1448314 RepID=A0A317VZR0_ASPEC|nr:kinase-like protein [Aspergillus eucalypticola CBS 122712]PWY78811.1 kinase-like protein [Aspergillus eucalypticola CBS 122712]
MSSTPCTACNWTPERQNHCNYKSHLNVFYESGNRGIWSIGSKVILKDHGPNHPTPEVPNIHFVQDRTSIPVPTIIKSWEEEEEDKHTLTLMRRIPGEPLRKDWSKLTPKEKENVAKQVAEYLQQLRTLQSDKIQCLGGRPVFSNLLFKNNSSSSGEILRGPFASDDELWAEMERGLDERIPEAARVRLRQRMPSAMPYTFTHGDLTIGNIMVESGTVTGVIGWEMAGYFPVWWEYVATSVPDTEEDREWKGLLRRYIPGYSAAREFWLEYWYFCRDLEGGRGRGSLRKMGDEMGE